MWCRSKPCCTWVKCRSAVSCTPTGIHCSWSWRAYSSSLLSLMRSYSLLSCCWRKQRKITTCVCVHSYFHSCMFGEMMYSNQIKSTVNVLSSVTLTWLAGCLRALSWWWCPPPASVDSSCKRLGPPPATHCSKQLDLSKTIIIIELKQVRSKPGTLTERGGSSVRLPISGLSSRLMMMRKGLRYPITFSGSLSTSFCLRMLIRA